MSAVERKTFLSLLPIKELQRRVAAGGIVPKNVYATPEAYKRVLVNAIMAQTGDVDAGDITQGEYQSIPGMGLKRRKSHKKGKKASRRFIRGGEVARRRSHVCKKRKAKGKSCKVLVKGHHVKRHYRRL